MSRLQADALILFAAMMWGLAFVGQSTAMSHVGPITFSGWRFALSALLVAPFALWERRRAVPVPKGATRGMIFLGFVFFLACAAQQSGLVTTSATKAGFFTALYVVMAPIIGFVFLKHRPPVAIWLAVVLSLAGAVFLSGGGFSLPSIGDSIVILSALFWALQILLLGELSARMDRPFALAFVQYVVVAILGIGLGFIFEAQTLPAFDKIWRELIFTGAISGAICFTLQAIAQRHTPATDAALLMSCEALFAALGGAVLLGDRLLLSGWIGCGLILAAVLLVQLAPMWRRKSVAPLA